MPSTEPAVREFRTQRCHLRCIGPDDAPWIAALNSDPDVMRFVSTATLTFDQALREAEERILQEGCDPHFGLWAIEDLASNEVHGWVALKPLAGTEEIEIGFRLRPSSWGRGIAAEAAAPLLSYAFQDLRLDRIVGVTMVGNAASERVLAKLGLHFEKRAVLDGIAWNNFALSRDQWQRVGLGKFEEV